MKRPSLPLLFPAFNETQNLPALLESAVEIGELLGLCFEIVVVDDGSRDTSAELLASWCRLDGRIHVVHHAANQGYGAALRRGLGPPGESRWRISRWPRPFVTQLRQICVIARLTQS